MVRRKQQRPRRSARHATASPHVTSHAHKGSARGRNVLSGRQEETLSFSSDLRHRNRHRRNANEFCRAEDKIALESAGGPEERRLKLYKGAIVCCEAFRSPKVVVSAFVLLASSRASARDDHSLPPVSFGDLISRVSRRQMENVKK